VSGQTEIIHDFAVFFLVRALRYELLPAKYAYAEIINPEKNSNLVNSIKLQTNC